MVQITLAGLTFPTKRALTKHIQSILWESVLGAPLPLEDDEVLRAILRYHPHGEEKAGVGILHITAEMVAAWPTQRGFWITRTDGTRVDFSYRECLRPSTHRAAVQQACRLAIVPQILAKKQRMFGGHDTYRCPVYDTVCTWHDVHVDHRDPLTFTRLVDDWLLSLAYCFDDIVPEETSDGLGMQLPEPLLSQWQAFHAAHADLWVVSIAAHKRLTAFRAQHKQKGT